MLPQILLDPTLLFWANRTSCFLSRLLVQPSITTVPNFIANCNNLKCRFVDHIYVWSTRYLPHTNNGLNFITILQSLSVKSAYR